MRTLIRYAIRFTLVVAVLMSLSLLIPIQRAANGPYVSALADLAAGSALAAPACQNKACVHDTSGKALCKTNPGTSCLRKPNGVLCGSPIC